MPNLSDARRTYAQSIAFVPGREELPIVLNSRGLFGCGVEVGVQRGLFSEHLLEHWAGSHVISIDPWAEDPGGEYIDIANVADAGQEEYFAETHRRLARFGSRSSIWRQSSIEASRRVPHHSLDFAYLDARHDFESVCADLAAWFDKVRPGGILAGHDYLDGTSESGVFGVKSAVDAFFAARGIAVYTTLLDEPWFTWMVEIPLPCAGIAATEAPPIPTASEQDADGERVAVTIAFEVSGEAREVKLRLNPNHLSQRMMLDMLTKNEMYEPETSSLLTSVLREGDTFVDVGTHVGFFSTLAASLVGSAGRVVSFEPEERNFRQLSEHVSINGFTNVDAICAAVGSEQRAAELWVNVDNDGGHALWDVGRHGFNAKSRRSPKSRMVQVTTLDSEFAGEQRDIPKLIKIDVEGSELRVLQGAEGLLRRQVPYVVCEINRFALEQMGATEDELRAYMASLGYETSCIHPQTGEIIVLKPDQHVVSEFVFNLLFRHASAPLVQAAA